MIREIDIAQLQLRRDARTLNAAKVEALADSIARTRLLSPIIVREIDGGKKYEVIAGAHRLQAHRVLGLAEIACDVVYDDDLHAELTMIDENLIRSELSPAERAQQTARRKSLYDELFPETVQHVAGGKARHDSASDNLSFAADTARATGKDQRTVQRDAERGAKVADKVLDFIRVTPLNTGVFMDRIKNLPPAEQMRVARAELAEISRRALEHKRVRQEAKKAARDQRERDLGEKQLALPDAKFGVIYADPEWRFEPYSRDTGMDRAADNHYPTSDLEMIKARPVGDIAADDCVLFLWATAPMLPQALEVMATWGFAYKSQVIWRKAELKPGHGVDPRKQDMGTQSGGLVLGTGYWFRSAHETLLVGTRGNVVAPAQGEQFPSIIDAPPMRHSQKPERFAELIEAYFPSLPKIELNARRTREGWTAWGLEAPDVEGTPDSDIAAVAPSGRVPGTPADDPSHTDTEIASEAAYRWALKPLAGQRGKLTQVLAEPAIRAAYEAGITEKQISADLGHPVGTIRTWIARLNLSTPGRQRRTVERADA